MFIQLEHFSDLAGDKAHGLLLEAAFPEGKVLLTADEQQLTQHFGHHAEVGTLEAFGIFAEAAVPVLSGVDVFFRFGLEGAPDAASFFSGNERAQPHVGRIGHRHHERDVVGADAHDVQLARDAAYLLIIDAFYLSYPLRGINDKLTGGKHRHPLPVDIGRTKKGKGREWISRLLKNTSKMRK